MTNDETLLPKYEAQLQQLAADLGLSETQRELYPIGSCSRL